MNIKFIAKKKPIPVKVYEFDGHKDVETIEGIAYNISGETHYVVEGAFGDQWPIEKEIFHKTYEIVEAKNG